MKMMVLVLVLLGAAACQTTDGKPQGQDPNCCTWGNNQHP